MSEKNAERNISSCTLKSMARYQLHDNDDVTSSTQSTLNLDFASIRSASVGSKMPMKHLDILEQDASLVDFEHPTPVEEMYIQNKISQLKQTRQGGYLGKQGINIETSPDSVKAQVDTLYFWDGLRKIDIVLAFEDGDKHEEEEEERLKKRNDFIRNLDEEGLDLELEPSRNSADGKTNFLKISAPNDLLQQYARILNLQIPTKKYNIISYGSNMELIESMAGEEKVNDRKSGCKGIFNIFDYDHTMIPPEPDFFTAGVSLDMTDRFIDKIQGDFFTSAQRSMIVWEVLMRTPYDDDAKDKVGIMRLLNNGVFEAAYPLHDGRYDTEGPDSEDGSTRRMLHQEWARFGCWYKRQPFSLIKRYFGDKIGLYFCWLGFYTKMLVLPSIVGLFVFLYGAATVMSDKNYPT